MEIYIHRRSGNIFVTVSFGGKERAGIDFGRSGNQRAAVLEASRQVDRRRILSREYLAFTSVDVLKRQP